MFDAPDIDEEDRAAIRDTLRFFEVDRTTYSYTHYAPVAVLIWAASRGFHALVGEGLGPFAGEAMALGLALCVGGMLSISQANEWAKKI